VAQCADTNSTKNEKGDNCLDVNEFTQFIQLVTKRQELDEIFKRLAPQQSRPTDPL